MALRNFADHTVCHLSLSQRPNSCLVFTEPASFPLAVKEQLLRFLFEEIQITRLCLLPKPLAVSYLFDVETCIVVDSGATNTSVAVVIEGRVDTARTRTAEVNLTNTSDSHAAHSPSPLCPGWRLARVPVPEAGAELAGPEGGRHRHHLQPGRQPRQAALQVGGVVRAW